MKIFELIIRIWKEFYYRDGLTRVGDLSFTLLLSLVPFAISITTIISNIPIFHNIFKQTEKIIFTHYLPGSGNSLYFHYQEFLNHSKQLSLIGFISLFVTVFLMLKSVESHINELWSVKKKRNIFQSILIYFSLIIIGPVFLSIGVFISISTETIFKNYYLVNSFLVHCITLLISSITFSSIYGIIPAKKIKLKFILIGGIMAALFFEIAKHTFVFYISNFTSYNLIYGSLAAFPLFLLWIYISSFILFLSAQIILTLYEIYE